METILAFGLGIGVTALLAALAALLLLSGLSRPQKDTLSSVFAERQTETLFIFDGEILVDSTPGGRAVLACSPAIGNPWQKLMAYLVPLFPAVEVHLATLSSIGTITLTSEDQTGQPLLLHADHRGGLTYLRLIDVETKGSGEMLDPLAHRAMTEELALLRNTLSQAPLFIWHENAAGEVVWANASYLLRASEELAPGQDLTWPLPRLFDPSTTRQAAPGQRQKLRKKDGSVAWYDVLSLPDGEGRKLYATSADALVAAETTLRDFMQTLTKTFAQLPIGLAIFDGQRQLQLFNPALLDLTNLAPDFLSRRPTLVAVLDALRANNMVPEPKNYREWRRQLVEVERAASSGNFEEIWTLPSGQTYRVTGRPHPNGALAFLIEDISNEISRSRRYHADLELGQSVIDAMEEAVAVFSDTGVLVVTNSAYTQLWQHNPSESLTISSITNLAQYWQAQTAASALWIEVEDYTRLIGDRISWSAQARLLDGRLLQCRFEPLAGGATMIGFQRVVASTELPQQNTADLLRTG